MKAIVLGVIAVVAVAGVTAAAIVGCGDWDKVRTNLIDRYGESRVVGGVMQNTIAVQWWMNAETGSWTLLGLRPEARQACIMAAGAYGHAFAPEDAGTDL